MARDPGTALAGTLESLARGQSAISIARLAALDQASPHVPTCGLSFFRRVA